MRFVTITIISINEYEFESTWNNRDRNTRYCFQRQNEQVY